jgi:hypothetical protein
MESKQVSIRNYGEPSRYGTFKGDIQKKREDLYQSFYDLFPCEFDVEKTGNYPPIVYEIRRYFSDLCKKNKSKLHSTGLQGDTFYKLMATITTGDPLNWKKVKTEILSSCCKACTGVDLHKIINNNYDKCLITMKMSDYLWKHDHFFARKFILAWDDQSSLESDSADFVDGFILFIKNLWLVDEVIVPKCAALLSAEYLKRDINYQGFLIRKQNHSNTKGLVNEKIIYESEIQIAETTFNEHFTRPQALNNFIDGTSNFKLLFYLCKVDLEYVPNEKFKCNSSKYQLTSVQKNNSKSFFQPGKNIEGLEHDSCISIESVLPSIVRKKCSNLVDLKLEFMEVESKWTIYHYRNPKREINLETMDYFQLWIESCEKMRRCMTPIHLLEINHFAHNDKSLMLENVLKIEFSECSFTKYKFNVKHVLFGSKELKLNNDQWVSEKRFLRSADEEKGKEKGKKKEDKEDKEDKKDKKDMFQSLSKVEKTEGKIRERGMKEEKKDKEEEKKEDKEEKGDDDDDDGEKGEEQNGKEKEKEKEKESKEEEEEEEEEEENDEDSPKRMSSTIKKSLKTQGLMREKPNDTIFVEKFRLLCINLKNILSQFEENYSNDTIWSGEYIIPTADEHGSILAPICIFLSNSSNPCEENTHNRFLNCRSYENLNPQHIDEETDDPTRTISGKNLQPIHNQSIWFEITDILKQLVKESRKPKKKKNRQRSLEFLFILNICTKK